MKTVCLANRTAADELNLMRASFLQKPQSDDFVYASTMWIMPFATDNKPS